MEPVREKFLPEKGGTCEGKSFFTKCAACDSQNSTPTICCLWETKILHLQCVACKSQNSTPTLCCLWDKNSIPTIFCLWETKILHLQCAACESQKFYSCNVLPVRTKKSTPAMCCLWGPKILLLQCAACKGQNYYTLNVLSVRDKTTIPEMCCLWGTKLLHLNVLPEMDKTCRKSFYAVSSYRLQNILNTLWALFKACINNMTYTILSQQCFRMYWLFIFLWPWWHCFVISFLKRNKQIQ